MINQLVNHTQLCAIKEIQYLLQESDEYKGNLILKNYHFRLRLIKYILDNLDHQYFEIENLAEIPKDSCEVIPLCPIEEKTKIRQLLQIGMSQIVNELLENSKYYTYQ